MCRFVCALRLEPGDATDPRCDPGQTGLVELDQVAVEGGRVPIIGADVLHHLGVRQGPLGVRQQPQDCNPWSRRPQPGIMEELLALFSAELAHRHGQA